MSKMATYPFSRRMHPAVESPRPEELGKMEFRVVCGNRQLATYPPEIMNVRFSTFIFFYVFNPRRWVPAEE
jgi:hypothetical protein